MVIHIAIGLYRKETIMKKALSAFLAVILVVSMTGCNTSSDKSVAEDMQNSVAAGDTVTQETEDIAQPLSVSVAMADGDIDMEKAMAYQTDIDALVASLEAKEIDPTKPVSANSNEDTIAVFDYLCSIYGKQILTAQQMKNDECLEDIAYYDNTGDMPAMKGYDFNRCMGSSPSDVMVDEAIEWHNESGGLVTFTWHWNVPRDIDDPDLGYAFYQEDIVNWSQINAVTPGTKEFEQVIHDIDLIASKLQKLEAAGVTVLFRPLHEASGSWFWWGVANREIAEGEYYQKLWYMIYDRLENYHKLTNLIWVWNGQSKHTVVHPNTYDISGIDVYPNSLDHSVQESKYNMLDGITEDGKMLALTEVGYIPDPDELAASETVNWLYYMPWNYDFVYSGTNIYGIPKINEERMTSEFLKKTFAHDNVITWSELPQWEGTTHEIPESINNQMMYINLTLEEEGKQ